MGKKHQEFEIRVHSFLAQAIKEKKMAAGLLNAAKACLQEKERKAKQEGESFGKREALLKAETLRLLERHEKFLSGLDDKGVEVAPSHSVARKSL